MRAQGNESRQQRKKQSRPIALLHVGERDRDVRIPKPLSTGVENAQKGFIYQIWQPMPNLDLFLAGTPMIGKNADTKALGIP